MRIRPVEQSEVDIYFKPPLGFQTPEAVRRFAWPLRTVGDLVTDSNRLPLQLRDGTFVVRALLSNLEYVRRLLTSPSLGCSVIGVGRVSNE